MVDTVYFKSFLILFSNFARYQTTRVLPRTPGITQVYKPGASRNELADKNTTPVPVSDPREEKLMVHPVYSLLGPCVIVRLHSFCLLHLEIKKLTR